MADGIADLGINGRNILLEERKEIVELKSLGFSRCRMSLAVPKDVDYQGLDYFNNQCIATSYPIILENFLNAHDISANVHKISGSVEIALSLIHI